MRKEDPHDIMTMMEAEEEAKRLGKLVEDIAEPIPEEEVETVKKMNRHERRAWLAKRRRAQKTGRL